MKSAHLRAVLLFICIVSTTNFIIVAKFSGHYEGSIEGRMPGELEQTSSNCDVLGNQAWRTITRQLTIVMTVGRLCLLYQSSCPLAAWTNG